MFDEVHRDQRAAEDDFEWVNAWAAASAREGKRPQVAAASDNAARTPVATAVALIEAPPLAEPALAAERVEPAQEPAAYPAPTSSVVAEGAASSWLGGIAPEPPVQCEAEAHEPAAAGPIADGDASIPQSTEHTPLPETPEQLRPSRRAPWTSLFRLISSDAGQLPRDRTGERPVETHEMVDALMLDAIPSGPEQCDAEVSLAPDQLERDIAEIEQVRDQLLLQHVASSAAPEPGFLRRTSDMVPILVGGALGFILLVVFGAAASFVSLR